MTGAFYVIRGKESLQAQSYERKENHGRKAEGQIQGDLDIELVAPNTRKKYPKRLRMVVFYDEKEDLYMELLTNNFTWRIDHCRTL